MVVGARRLPRRRQRRGAGRPAPGRPGRRAGGGDLRRRRSSTTTAPGGPPMSFVRDHYEAYDAPRLVVRLLRDTGGTPYLLLHGPRARQPLGGVRPRGARGGRALRRHPGREHGLGADGGAAHPADRDHPPRQPPRPAAAARARGAASCGSRPAPRRCWRCGWGSGATTRWASSRTSRTTSRSSTTRRRRAALLEQRRDRRPAHHRPRPACAPRPRTARPRSPATSPPTTRSARWSPALEQQYDAFERAEAVRRQPAGRATSRCRPATRSASSSSSSSPASTAPTRRRRRS